MDKRNSAFVTSTDPEQSSATEEEGIPVRIFDLRRDERIEVADADGAQEDKPEGVDTSGIGPVLVLP